MSKPASTPTLDQVAQVAGVSRTTASRAINGGLRVSPEAQEAVDRAVAQLGYFPNRAARSLVTRRTDSIALVVPEPDERILTDPFLAEILRGVNAELAETDLQLVMLIAKPGEHSSRISRYLRNGHVDGAIIASHHRSDELEDAVRSSGLPAVYIGRPFEAGDDLVYVDVDNAEGARLGTRHLVDSGRRVIGTVAGPQDMSAGVDRLTGWREVIADAGMDLTACELGDFTVAGGAAAMERLLASHPDLDGVFVASDPMALGALQVLSEAGRSVPGDVGVVGFDNFGQAARSRPPLTTVDNPASLAVTTATRLVLEMVAGRPIAETRTILPATLVVRASS